MSLPGPGQGNERQSRKAEEDTGPDDGAGDRHGVPPFEGESILRPLGDIPYEKSARPLRVFVVEKSLNPNPPDSVRDS